MLPGGEHYLEDLDWAGGIPAVMKRLRRNLNNNITVSGKKIFEIADSAEVTDENVIRPLNKAYHKEGGIAILRGNLAPDGAVVKQSAVSKNMMKYEGSAKVFNSEEEGMKAILNGKIKAGDIVVIRYEGPKRRPRHEGDAFSDCDYCRNGPERISCPDNRWKIFRRNKRPMHRAYITGAMEGGVIAILKDGDRIKIDIPNRKIDVLLSDKRN